MAQSPYLLGSLLELFHPGSTTMCADSSQRPENGIWRQAAAANTCTCRSGADRGLPSSRESHRFLMLNIPWCPHTSPELRCWRSHRIFPSRLHYLSEPHMPRQGMQTEPGGLPPARRPDPKALPSLSLCARPGGIWAVLANAYLLHLHFCFRDESLGEN